MLKNLIIITNLFILTACGVKNTAVNTTELSAKEMYSRGVAAMQDKKYKTARKFFANLTTEYPYYSKANQAQYFEALTSYKAKDYTRAINAAKEYIELYPAGANIEDCFYIKAIAHYDQIEEIRLDQSETIAAKQSFEELIARFPKSNYVQDIKFKLDLINDFIAGKEMLIGRFYLKKDNFSAAINRFTKVIDLYSSTKYIQEALYRLTECYIALGLTNEAKKYASILGNNYSSSIWYKRSYNVVSKS